MSAKVTNSSDPISIEQISALRNRRAHFFHANFNESRIGRYRFGFFFPGWEKILKRNCQKESNLQSYNLGLNSESVK